MDQISISLPDTPTANTTLWFRLGKPSQDSFRIGLDEFYLKIDKGAFADMKVAARLQIPRLMDPTDSIGVSLYLDADGDFDVTASFPGKWKAEPPETDLANGIIGIPSVFMIRLDRLSVGKDDDEIYLDVGGALRFTHPLIRNFLQDELIIQKLKIDTKGRISVVGGSIPLPRNIEVPLGPAKVAITAVHTGKMERDGHTYSYFGFSGALSMTPSVVDASGDSFKVCYRRLPSGKYDVFFHIEGLAIDITIPGDASRETAAVLLSGYLSVRGHIYEGGVSLELPKLGIAGGATIKYDTKAPAFLLDVGIEWPVPIPLAATNLGIYGARGTFGQRYIAVRDEDERWFDWYVEAPRGVDAKKLIGPSDEGFPEHLTNPFTIGAGLSLATVADEGKAFTSQFMLLVSIPTLIMLDGTCDIMAEKRLGLDSKDAPFWAFVGLSPQDQSIELGIGVDYKIPKKTGKVLDLSASIEMGFFFKDSSAWYINIGREDRPIRARILSLFDAQSYLMLSARGVRAGASVTLAFSKSYLGGKIQAHASAYFKIWGFVSFEDWQLGGGIAVGGALDISFFGFGLFASLDAILMAEASKPSKVNGAVEVCVGVRILGKKIERCFDVKFSWIGDQGLQFQAKNVVKISDADGTSVAAIHRPSRRSYPIIMLAGDQLPGNGSNIPVIPMDSMPDLKFAKPVQPSSAIEQLGGINQPASGFIEYVPPSGSSRRVRHEYQLEDVRLEIFDGASWQLYDPYKAVDIALTDTPPAGYWQNMGGAYDKVRFMSETPFAYMDPGNVIAPERSGQTPEKLFCETSPLPRHCVHWKDRRGFKQGTHYKSGLYYSLSRDGYTYANGPKDPFVSSLAINMNTLMTVWFENPARDIRIDLSSCARRVRLRFQTRVEQPPVGEVWMAPTFEDLPGSPIELETSQLVSPVTHDGIGVDRILIEVVSPDAEQIEEFDHSIRLLETDLLTASRTGNIAAVRAIEKKRDSVRSAKREYLNRFCKTGEIPLPEKDPKATKELADIDVFIKRIDRDITRAKKAYATLNIDTALARTDANIAAISRRYEAIMANLPTLEDRFDPKRRDDTKNRKGVPDWRKVDPRLKHRLKRLSDDLAKLKTERKQLVRQADGITKPLKELEAKRAKYVRQRRFILDELARQKPSETAKSEGCCELRVNEICWMDVDDAIINAQIPSHAEIQIDIDDSVEAITKHVEPIFRPYSTFRIFAKVVDRMSAPNYTTETDQKTYSALFQTSGPIGYYTLDQVFPSLADEVAQAHMTDGGGAFASPEAQYAELKLAPYLDTRRCTPDPLGKFQYAKPLYRQDAEIDLYFMERYAYHFFQSWPSYAGLSAQDFAMQVEIVDPVKGPDSHPEPGHIAEVPPVSTAVDWITDLDAFPNADHKVLKAMQNAHPCGAAPITDITPAAKAAKIKMDTLDPRKTYTAIIYNSNGMDRRVVHRFPFISSTYLNFEDQVGDHILRYREDERPAIFKRSLSLGASGSDARARLAQAVRIAGGRPLEDSQYAHGFDQLVFEVLGDVAQSPRVPIGHDLDDAGQTEFTFLHDNISDTVFGLLIRSIEAFNDPRLTPAELAGTITFIDLNTGAIQPGCEVILSRDGAQALILNASGLLTDDTAVAFARKVWAGRVLVTDQTVQVDVAYSESV